MTVRRPTLRSPLAHAAMALVLGLTASATATAQGFPTRYAIATELPAPSGRPDAEAFQFNNLGQATGYGFFREGSILRLVFIDGKLRFVQTPEERGVGVRWNGSVGTLLPALASRASATVADINDNAWIAGQSNPSRTATRGQAVVWQGSKIVDLRAGESSAAQFINNLGWVVGYRYMSGDYAARPFLWRNSRLEDLGGFLPTSVSINAKACVGVSDNGLIPCRALVADPNSADFRSTWRSFVWNNGAFQELAFPGVAEVVVTAVSPGGIVAGSLRKDTDPEAAPGQLREQNWPFLWRNGELTIQPRTAPGTPSSGYQVDDQGTVLMRDYVDNVERPLVRLASGEVIDVRTLTVASGDRIVRVHELNAKGQLLAAVRKGTGAERIVVLSPVTP
ncbi:MAG: hypothetical protein EOP40_07080 [Rubrivivax sp.]|nr:MAG: hypothetical protein EOP40_07080 [Rubrivivax sp.]